MRRIETREDASVLIWQAAGAEGRPNATTENLPHWATDRPDTTCLWERDGADWRRVSFAEGARAAQAMASALLDLGLLGRTPVEGDRRRHALMPTTEGRALCARAEQAVAAHEARVFAMLDGAEKAALLALLRKIRADWPGKGWSALGSGFRPPAAGQR